MRTRSRRGARRRGLAPLLAHGGEPRHRERKGLAGNHTAGDVCSGFPLGACGSRDSSWPHSLFALQTWPEGRPLLWHTGPVCAVGGELGTPRGDHHPLGLADTPPWGTLIRASSSWGLGRAAQPGSHVASCWLLRHWQVCPISHGDKLASQGARPQQPPLGFLKRVAGLVLMGICPGGSCLLEMGHSYTP